MKWTESIDVHRPLAEVQRLIADEHELMQWSAWPQATGFTCAIDGDGRALGSSIVFRDGKGVEQGRQLLTLIEPARVEYRLHNRGPGGRTMAPDVDFRLEATGPDTTRVHLDFRATAPLPPGIRHLVEALMARRIRALHVKDLQLLKAHAERQPATP